MTGRDNGLGVAVTSRATGSPIRSVSTKNSRLPDGLVRSPLRHLHPRRTPDAFGANTAQAKFTIYNQCSRFSRLHFRISLFSRGADTNCTRYWSGITEHAHRRLRLLGRAFAGNRKSYGTLRAGHGRRFQNSGDFRFFSLFKSPGVTVFRCGMPQ